MLAAPTFFPGQSQKPKWHLLISSRLCDVGGGSAAPPAPAPSSCYWSGPLPTRFQWKPEGGGGGGGRREAKGARSLCRWGWGPGLAQQEASDQVQGGKQPPLPQDREGVFRGPPFSPLLHPYGSSALLFWLGIGLPACSSSQEGACPTLPTAVAGLGAGAACPAHTSTPRPQPQAQPSPHTQPSIHLLGKPPAGLRWPEQPCSWW